MKSNYKSFVGKSLFLTALVAQASLGATWITTAKATPDNNSNLFEQQIQKKVHLYQTEQQQISSQFSFRADADRKIAADQQKKRAEAAQAAQAARAEQNVVDQTAVQRPTENQVSSNQQVQAQTQAVSVQVQKPVTDTTAAAALASSSDSNYGVADDPAKEWIKSVESGGDPNASNGQYQGMFQMSSQAAAEYGGYSGQAADRYVAARYGSWSAAAEHHRVFGWY